MSTPVCIANAVADALSSVRDIADLRLPLTPSKLLGLIGLDDPPASAPARPPSGAVAPAPPAPATAAASRSPATPDRSPVRRLLRALGLVR